MPVHADEAWTLFTDLDRWPEWGPSVRSATLDDTGGEVGFVRGATGTVEPVVGPALPFELTDVTVEGDVRRWTWKVAGVPATAHSVEALGPRRCRIGFGVPAVAAPYLAVCRVALARMARSLT